MLIALLGLLAVLSVPVAGGRLTRLLDLHLRFTWVLLLGLLIQIVIISIVPGAADDWLHRALHLGTYGLGFLWLAANPSFPWRWILTIGGALNFLVIAVNGGVMPASESALVRAGEEVGQAFTNSTAVEGARLAFLGDIFTVPSWVPFGNVFSIGDVLIVVGGFLMVHAACESRIGRLLVPIQDPPLLRWRAPDWFMPETPATASAPAPVRHVPAAPALPFLRWRAPDPVPEAGAAGASAAPTLDAWTGRDSIAPSSRSTLPTPPTPYASSSGARSVPRSSPTLSS